MNIREDKKQHIIPVVFAVDDNYCSLLSVALTSILKNSSKDVFFKFYVLNTVLSSDNEKKLSVFNGERSSIEYVNVMERLSLISSKLHLRDYYTNAIYYRLFIPALFSNYKKVIYLDSDIVVLDDLKKLYSVDLKDNIIGAVSEEVMSMVNVFSEYSEDFLGVDRKKYFNSGLLVINCEKYREERIEEKFVDMLSKYEFKVAPDQDYLNVLCKDKVLYLNQGWNKAPVLNNEYNDTPYIVHYKLWYKPWLYDNIMYENYFWEYAKLTNYYDLLRDMKSSVEQEGKAISSLLAFKNLMKLARSYVLSENNYKKLTEKENNDGR